MAPKFIYFDLGQVLLRFSRERQYRQMADAAGSTPEAIREAWETSKLYERYEAGEFTTREAYEQLCQALGVSCDLAALEQATADIFWVNASMLPLVSSLWSAGYPLGILSNTCATHWNLINSGRYGFVANYFQHAVLSFEVGALKPDPKTYAAAIDKSGAAAAEIFYMDDREENVVGAKNSGIDAVLYTDTPSLAGELRRRGVKFNY